MRMLAPMSAVLMLAACTASEPERRTAVPEHGLDTLTVQRETSVRERVWDGVVEAVNQATLSAQTAGRVVELPFDVNDYVSAGSVVVRFTDVEQQAALRRAQAQVGSAEAAFREANADYERIAELYQRKLVAKAQLDQATARRDAARATRDAANAALREAQERTDYTVVRAPYTGIVTERHVEVGESVSPGQALISGLSLEKLRIAVSVPQSEVAAIRQHQRAAVLLDDGRRIPAERVTVFPYADPHSHSFSVRLELPEADTGLHPGMTVKAAFVIGERERLLLPAGALLRRSEVTAVYVAEDDGRVVMRQIRTGHRDDGRVEVLAGLDPGERIVLDPVAARAFLADTRTATAP